MDLRGDLQGIFECDLIFKGRFGVSDRRVQEIPSWERRESESKSCSGYPRSVRLYVEEFPQELKGLRSGNEFGRGSGDESPLSGPTH